VIYEPLRRYAHCRRRDAEGRAAQVDDLPTLHVNPRRGALEEQMSKASVAKAILRHLEWRAAEIKNRRADRADKEAGV
jgi:hypothetical protein